MVTHSQSNYHLYSNMDVYSLSRPLSPGSVEVFSRYTTILDDETLMHEAIALPDDFQTDPLVPQDVLASSLNSSLSPQTSKNQLINHPPRNKNHERTSIESEPNFAEDTLAGFSCFYAGTGEPTKTPRRAPLSAQKKSKVWDIRKRGACLRCILLKREVSLHQFTDLLILTPTVFWGNSMQTMR
jgi:hypothetical protein